jgi:hypothetical protein
VRGIVIQIDKIIQFLKTKAGQQLLWVIGVLFAAFFAAGGFLVKLAYDWGKDAGEKNLAVMQTLKDIDFTAISRDAKDSVANLRSAAKNFESLLVRNEDYQSLKLRLQEMEVTKQDTAKANEQLKRDIEEAKAEAQKLKDELAALRIPTQSFRVTTGRVTLAGEGKLGMTLSYISSNRVEINFNGVKRFADIGDRFFVNGSDGWVCEIRLNEIDYRGNVAILNALCASPKPP